MFVHNCEKNNNFKLLKIIIVCIFFNKIKYRESFCKIPSDKVEQLNSFIPYTSIHDKTIMSKRQIE